MATAPTVTITGPIEMPDAAALTGAVVQFALTGRDVDLSAGVTINPNVRAAVLDSNGDFSIDLWPNSRGQFATRYRITVVGQTSSGPTEWCYGELPIPEDGAPHDLDALIAAQAAPVNAVLMGLITQAQYDAAIAAVAAAVAAQAAAEAAAATIDVDKLAGIEVGATRDFDFYDSVASLLASSETSRGVGDVWRAGEFSFVEVAASGDVENAAGVHLDALPDTHGWVSIEQLGAVYDGDGAKTDQASKVQALIDAGHKRISLGRSGVLYLASTITTPDSDPEDPICITSHGAKAQAGGNTRIFDLGQATKMWLVQLTGSGETSGNTSENFVYISGNGLDDVRHNTFLDCGGTAVIVRQYYTTHEGSQIVANIIKRCRVAIDLQERGEYTTVSQNILVQNGTAFVLAAGNTRAVNNTICDNDLGLLVTTGANDAHGLVANNIINHNTINLQIDAINVDEMSFDGNLFYVGKIVLNGCSGVTFNGGVIDATCSIEQKECTNCWAIGVRMSGGSAINTVANDGGPSELVFVDPILDTAIAVTASASMGTSYAKARRSGAVTLASAASTDLVFNTDDTNAIPGNAAYTLRDFFDVTTNEFQAKSQFLHRSFTVDFHALITVSHPSLSVAATDAAAEIVDADDTTNVLGVFTVSREKTLASGRNARVLSFSGKLERKDFLVRLYNDGANTLTIEADIADAPCFAELTGV